MFNVLVLHYHFEGNFCLVSVLNYVIKNVIIIQHHSFQWSLFPDGTVQTMVNISSGQECLKIAFVNCLQQAKKQMCFNYWSGDKDSANTDLEKETEDEGNCSEKTTEESEIRAEWSADDLSPGTLSPPNYFEMFCLSYNEIGIASDLYMMITAIF